MANCADCGRNPKRGCLPECPRDKTRSVWARYRARKKAKAYRDVIIVGPGSGGPATIRDAMEHAKPGDSIVCLAGAKVA